MKISIHPLFFAVIIICAIFGGLPTMLICLVTALLHECGHIFCAHKMGYECAGIKLMPYGAAAVCDIEGISAREEVYLALSGPAVNAAISVSIVALWWFFPETYAYTDVILNANLAMLIINLLPAYPLDGGRVAGCILKKLFGQRAAQIVLKVVALLFAAVLTVLFFVRAYNPTFLIFALFLSLSIAEKAPRASLINFADRARLKRGLEVKYILCGRDLTFRQAFRLLDEKRYTVFCIYATAVKIPQEELYSLAVKCGAEEGVYKAYLSKKERSNSPVSISPLTTALTHSAPKSTAPSTADERERKS